MERKRIVVGDSSTMSMEEEEERGQPTQPVSKRRTIRSHYREIETRINEKKDEIGNLQTGKFIDILSEVENIHQHVEKPREQVADAEALLGLTRTLVECVKTHTSGGVTPAEFVSRLITQFGHPATTKELCAKSHTISWKIIGSCVSPIFMNASACITMIGPMNNVLKPRRKSVVRKKRSMLTRKARPKELKKVEQESTDTVTNANAMYKVLKEAKKVKVENLILNRHSFAQTVENLFALSFLVKDGRVVIGVDEISGSQFAVPKNGPSAQEIKSGLVTYHHFIFRLDFNEWKLMKSVVVEGEEVMEPRPAFTKEKAEAEAIPSDSELTITAASVKKLSRNYKAFTSWL